MNFFDTEELLTLLELQGQELTRLQHDLKIKEETDLPQIKELIKKCENHWKQLHSLIIRKLGMYQPSVEVGCQDTEHSQMSAEKRKLLTTIRFQIQMLYSPIAASKDTAEGTEEKSKKFHESLCKGLAANMVNYFKFSISYQDRMMLEEETPSKRKNLKEIDTETILEFKDHSIDLYWLEMISLNLDQVSKSKSKKTAPSSRALNIKLMMSMNNLKKCFKEYSEFAISFGAYYERYFVENESQDSDLELVRNFGRIIYLFSKGFNLPGRQKIEDLRNTFTSLLKAFRIPQITTPILNLLKKKTTPGSLFSESSTGLRQEMVIMIFNIYKLLIFIMFSLEFEEAFFRDLFKIWMHLCWQVYDAPDFLRINRLVHILMHKPSMSQSENLYRAHSVYFEYDIKLLLCNNAVNIIKGATCPSAVTVKMAEKELLQLYRCLYCNF
jgi:hypothetical protein